MRINFCKSLAKTIKTATTTKYNTKIAVKLCRQKEKFLRWQLSTTIILHKCCTTRQQQQQQKLFKKQQQQQNTIHFLRVQRFYGIAIQIDSHDLGTQYAELRSFAKDSPSDGNKSSKDDKTDRTEQQCASYVDAVAATAVAAATLAGGFTTLNATKIEDASVAAAGVPADVARELEDAAQDFACSSECLPMLRTFVVQLDFVPEPHELVGLTGDAKALGEWRLENCITLHPQSNLNRQAWSANVMLPRSAEQTCYRYFIYTEDAQGRKQIRHWETHLQPRTLSFCNSDAQLSDHFGVIDAADSNDTRVILSRTHVRRGWLTFESIIQFKFEREHMFQVHDAEKFDAEHVQIKLELLDQGEQFVGVHVDVARLDYGQSHLQKQQHLGTTYKKGDVVIFHLTVADLRLNAFAVLFYTPEGVPIGRTHITPDMLKGSEGELELDILAPKKDKETATAVVAKLILPYVIIRPYKNANLLDFRTTYAHYWPKSWPNLDVGHRGNGRSFIANPPTERENTLASFMRAFESYADMIELDVHLTADGIPIIYHDFGMLTAPQDEHITSRDQLEYVLIKDVNYELLKQMRVFAMINGKPVEYPAHNAEPRIDHRIFPRLRDVLETLPKTLGIDVEIKWPQRTACGGVEAQQTIDKNLFVDRVLDTIIYHGCGRPLIFSSFDADICTMLRFKQNIFPVMFLTMGETKKWNPYMDLRTRNFVQAINTAQAFELAGTAPHAEDFIGEHGSALMQKAIEVGQIAVVWGDDCNSKERVKYFSAIGATATCYDRADLFMPEHKERAFFDSSSLIAKFEAQCPWKKAD